MGERHLFVRGRLLTVLVAGLLVGLAACSTPLYKQASGPYGLGYSEAALEEGRYRITFRARDLATAYDFALLRAAELTLAKGYTWFRVTNTIGDEHSDDYPRSRVSVGTGYGDHGHYGSRWGFGLGFPLGGSSRDAVASIDIQLGKGEKPEDSSEHGKVYDAASVKATIGPRVGSKK